MNKRSLAFTLIELLVVISIITVLIGFLVPAVRGAREAVRQAQNTQRLSGIHVAMTQFAQGNNEWYPGLRPNGLSFADVDNGGSVSGDTVQARYRLLLVGNYLNGEYLISPIDTGKSVWISSGSAVTHNNYSYALLDISDLGSQRKAEWSQTVNARAIAVSDRVIAPTGGSVTAGNPQTYRSIHTPRRVWEGGVVWNDGRGEMIQAPVLSQGGGGANAVSGQTQYGNADANATDDLFDEDTTGATAGANARMVYVGDDQITP